MKRTCRHSLLTLLLAAAMLFAMTVPAFAAAREGTPSDGLWAAYPNIVRDAHTNEDYVVFSTDELSSGPVYSWTKVQSEGVVFGTCNVDGEGKPIPETFRPIPAAELTASEGLALDTKLPLRAQGDPYDKYYVTPRPDADGKDYTVSWQGHSITVTSRPWGLDFFREPRISLDTWRAGYYTPQVYFDPVHSAQPYYVGSFLTDETDGRHLAGLSLSDWPYNSLVELTKVRDGLYRLDLKETAFYHNAFKVELKAEWQGADGASKTEYWPFTFRAERLVVASETPLFEDTLPISTSILYDDAADKISPTLTLTAGEEKEVYLYTMFQSEDYMDWWAIKQRPYWYHTSDEGLTLTPAGEDSAKYTLRCDKAGSYEIYVGFKRMDYYNMRLYHDDGTLYTPEEWKEFDETVICGFYPDGSMKVQANYDQPSEEIDNDKYVSFEEMFPGQRYELDTLGIDDYNFWRLAVNVEDPSKDFSDVAKDAWYYSDLDYCVRKGLLQGTGEDTFSPDGTAQRRAVVTILHRMKQEPKARRSTFSDVPAGEWYTAAVDWAAETGVVKGYGDNTFRPARDLSRQELAVLLYRFAQAEGCDVSGSADLSAYSDAGQVADWALPAVKWAVAQGMLHTEGGRLDPSAKALRCDLAHAFANLS